MRRRRSATLVLALVTALLGAGLLATVGASARATSVSFDIVLTGAAEIPGPGDPDGSGDAHVTVYPDLGVLCYTLRVSGIETPTLAHIHRITNPNGTGSPVIPFKAPKKGSVTDCVKADPALLGDIVETPEEFYVNVHNATYPSGALRGDLPGGVV